VYGDEVRLRQVVNNLVGNAVAQLQLVLRSASAWAPRQIGMSQASPARGRHDH
jgi:hypothetical protein